MAVLRINPPPFKPTELSELCVLPTPCLPLLLQNSMSALPGLGTVPGNRPVLFYSGLTTTSE